MKVKEGLNEDARANYMLLGRLQSDCEYFLKYPHKKHLWSGNVVDQIKKMKELLKLVKEPEWLSLKQVKQYEKDMTDLLA